MSENNLLTCPFCRTKATVFYNNRDSYWGVTCMGCTARIYGYSTRELALAYWNKRNQLQEEINKSYQMGYRMGVVDGLHSLVTEDEKCAPLLDAIRKLDYDCDYCAHNGNCKHYRCEGDCMECDNCGCQCNSCRNNSNWTWGG